MKGIEKYKKWKAFKKFLKDFGKFKDKEIFVVELWEKYLVYATLFGYSKKILKVLKIEFSNEKVEYFNTYFDLYVTNKCIANTVKRSYNSARSAKISESSGGGSFGGGGGGGRF